MAAKATAAGALATSSQSLAQWDKLPPEILMEMFRQWPRDRLRTARMLCRTFYHIADPLFFTEVNVCLRSYDWTVLLSVLNRVGDQVQTINWFQECWPKMSDGDLRTILIAHTRNRELCEYHVTKKTSLYKTMREDFFTSRAQLFPLADIKNLCPNVRELIMVCKSPRPMDGQCLCTSAALGLQRAAEYRRQAGCKRPKCEYTLPPIGDCPGDDACPDWNHHAYAVANQAVPGVPLPGVCMPFGRPPEGLLFDTTARSPVVQQPQLFWTRPTSWQTVALPSYYYDVCTAFGKVVSLKPPILANVTKAEFLLPRSGFRGFYGKHWNMDIYQVIQQTTLTELILGVHPDPPGTVKTPVGFPGVDYNLDADPMEAFAQFPTPPAAPKLPPSLKHLTISNCYIGLAAWHRFVGGHAQGSTLTELSFKDCTFHLKRPQGRAWAAFQHVWTQMSALSGAMLYSRELAPGIFQNMVRWGLPFPWLYWDIDCKEMAIASAEFGGRESLYLLLHQLMTDQGVGWGLHNVTGGLNRERMTFL